MGKSICTVLCVKNRTVTRNTRRKVTLIDLTWPPVDTTERSTVYARLNRWTPKGTFSQTALTYARAIAWYSNTQSWQLAVRTARAAVRHATRLEADGVALDIMNGLSREQVEFTIATILKPLPGATRTNEASALRVAARALNPLGGWPTTNTTPNRRLPVEPPYTDLELANLLRQAQALKSTSRAAHLTACLSLMAGAGITSGELQRITWADINVTEEGTVTVTVDGRTIPVLNRYAHALRTLAQGADPSELVVPPARADTALVRMNEYARSHGMTGWSTTRAVNTWRITQMSRVPLPVLLRGTNRSASHIAQLLVHCPIPGPDALAALSDDPKAGA